MNTASRTCTSLRVTKAHPPDSPSREHALGRAPSLSNPFFLAAPESVAGKPGTCVPKTGLLNRACAAVHDEDEHQPWVFPSQSPEKALLGAGRDSQGERDSWWGIPCGGRPEERWTSFCSNEGGRWERWVARQPDDGPSPHPLAQRGEPRSSVSALREAARGRLSGE